MMNHSETITKSFSSKRQVLNFIHFLEVDEFLIRRNGESWDVLYNTNKTTITLTEEEFSRVDVIV